MDEAQHRGTKSANSPWELPSNTMDNPATDRKGSELILLLYIIECCCYNKQTLTKGRFD